MKPLPAIATTVSLALLAACGVAWAQDMPTPSMTAGVGDLGLGGLGGLIIVGVDRLIGYLRQSRADERAERSQAGRDADREALRRELHSVAERVAGLSSTVVRLEERQAAHGAQAAQLHDDLGAIRGTLDSIRDRLPRLPPSPDRA